MQEKPLARRLEMGRRRLAAVPAGEASVGPILLDEASVVFLRRARADTLLFATFSGALATVLESLCVWYRVALACRKVRAPRRSTGRGALLMPGGRA